MDKNEFYEHLHIVKNFMYYAQQQERILHSFDFFSWYDELAPEVFNNYSKEQIYTPAFKMDVWKLMCQSLAMMETSRPKVDNVIDFNMARTKLRA